MFLPVRPEAWVALSQLRPRTRARPLRVPLRRVSDRSRSGGLGSTSITVGPLEVRAKAPHRGALLVAAGLRPASSLVPCESGGYSEQTASTTTARPRGRSAGIGSARSTAGSTVRRRSARWLRGDPRLSSRTSRPLSAPATAPAVSACARSTRPGRPHVRRRETLRHDLRIGPNGDARPRAMRYAYASFVEIPGGILRALGQLAQRESTRLTREGSLVRSQYCPSREPSWHG